MKARNDKNEGSKVIDNKPEAEVSVLFTNKCESTFNNNPINKQETETIKLKVEDSMTSSDYQDVTLLTCKLVTEVVGRLKPVKIDYIHSTTTDILINVGAILMEHLALFYRQCLLHGYFPANILECIMVSVIKDVNGDTGDVNNYQSIAISSMILLVFDWILILLFGDKLKTAERQFRFQASSNLISNTLIFLDILIIYLKKGGFL